MSRAGQTVEFLSDGWPGLDGEGSTAALACSKMRSWPLGLGDIMRTTEPSTDDDLEQRVAFEAIRGRLFGSLGQPVSIGRFVITGRLGQGGMGVVYAAFDPQLDRKVAVKVLRDMGDAAHAASARRSLEREARAAAGLSHPNVVTVYDSGPVGEGFYVAMELVEGSTLRTWLQTPRCWPEIVRMFVAAGRGLQAAHEAGLIHCDFKPDNVLVGEDGRPRVVDFGLVKWTGRAVPSDRARGPTAPQATVQAGTGTGTGTVIGGTPAYMPPEQFDGRAEARSDQYAFCVALYRALFGTHPYGVGDRLSRAHKRTRVPRGVVQAILRGLAPQVEQRHATMQALADRLQRVLRRRARLPWVAAAVLLAGTGGGLGYASAMSGPCGGATAIDAAWTESARDAVRASLQAAGDPAQVEGLVQRLDDHADAWRQMHRESCQATHERGEQSPALLELRTACLGRRRNTFEHVVERLQTLQADQGHMGRELVERLPSLDACAADVVRAQVAVRGQTQTQTDRSRSPESNAAFEEVTDLLDRALGEELLGTRAQALALAWAAEQRAHQMGLRYLEAEAIELRVSLQIDGGEVAGAEAALERALQLAVEADDAGVAARVVARLLSLEGRGAAAVESRSLLATLGRAWAGRTRRGATLRALIAYEEATHALDLGDHETGLARADAALADLEAEGLAEDSIALGLRMRRGIALTDAGRLEEATHELADLLALQRARLPPHHAALATTTFYLADAMLRRGKVEEALPLAQESYANYHEHLGPDEPVTLTALTLLARAWEAGGDRARAAATLEAVIEGQARVHGYLHVSQLEALHGLAELEYGAGALGRARGHAMAAAIVATQSLGGTHVVTSMCRTTLGKVVLDLGELQHAGTLLDDARIHIDGTNDPTAPAEVTHHLARLAMRSSPPDPARAVRLSDEALAFLRGVEGSSAARLTHEILAWRRQPFDPRAP